MNASESNNGSRFCFVCGAVFATTAQLDLHQDATRHERGDVRAPRRPTITARKARDKQAARLLRQRRATSRAQARIRRTGTGTLATHGIAAGLTVTEARTVASSLRTAAKRLGVTGCADTTFRKGARRDCTRYTTAEVALVATAYRPRKAAYVAAKNRLALAA